MINTPVNKNLQDQFNSSDDDAENNAQMDDSPIKMTPKGKQH